MPTQTESAVILQHLPGIGATGLANLVDQFGSFDNVLSAPLEALPGVYRKALQYYRREANAVTQAAQDVIARCRDEAITLAILGGENYPSLLAEIDCPPPVLYIKGRIDTLHLPQIAIVGSRQHTATGKHNAEAFARDLSRHGFTITSGMALGIDGIAHHAVVEKGSTVAVLGTGVDTVYPRQHNALYQAIIDNGGAVLSEFPLGTPARAGNFPQRNRIISGLSVGVVVIEAALRSGSLITARHALEQGREVFALPGSIHNPMAKGCHQLIRNGATLVENSQDIVEQLGGMLSLLAASPPPGEKNQPTIELNTDEQNVLDQLAFDNVDLDTLVHRCGLATAQITSTLVSLELKGLVANRAGLYCRIS